jgi:hypothetical protein
LGEDLRHGDVHADQVSLLVLEVPGRIGAAGADDQVAAVEHGAQQAVARGLRVGHLRRERGRGGCRGRGAGQPEAAGEHERTSVGIEILHGPTPFF